MVDRAPADAPQTAAADERTIVYVAATLLDLAGLDATGLDGISVAPDLGRARVDDRSVYSETMYPRLHFGWADLASAIDSRFHFIRAPRPELFDWTNDPRERTNIVEAKYATVTALSGWLDRTTAGAALAEPAAVTSEVRDRLKALGYIGASAPKVRRPLGCPVGFLGTPGSPGGSQKPSAGLAAADPGNYSP